MILYVLPAVGISGGVAVALYHVTMLTSRGYDAAVLSMSEGDDISWFPGASVRVYRTADVDRLVAEGITIAVATHYSTVPFVLSLTANRKIYFVQSDERRFDLPTYDAFRACNDSYQTDMEFMTEALWIQRWLKEEFGKDAYYVPNGLDPAVFYPSGVPRASRRQRILLEGSIAFGFKGMDDAYAAVSGLDADIWIVSNNGRPKDEWQYDKFLEKVPFYKMREIYGACDIFVKMSKVEGFFGPPLEAMACGCAVAVAEVTGYDEYVRDGENALVVPAGDILRMRIAVQRLLDDSSLRRHLIDGGRATATAWTWERSGDFLEEVVRGTGPVSRYADTVPRRYDYDAVMRRIIEGFLLAAERRGIAEELASCRRDLAFVQSSKFWRVRDAYCAVKARMARIIG